MSRSGINRQHVEPVAQPPPPKRGGIYSGEIPVHGVDYEEDGRCLSQTLLHDAIASNLRFAIAQHCLWLDTRENVLAVDVLIVYRDDGRIVTVAPDVMLAKGRPPTTRPSPALAWEGRRAPLMRPPETPAYLLVVEGRPPDLALEVVSPKNSPADLRRKKAKYVRIGIPEYFVFDPYPKESDPPLKRYRLQPGGEAWEKKTSRSGLRSKELDTDILVDGWRLAVIDPETGQPYESAAQLQARVNKAAAARRKLQA